MTDGTVYVGLDTEAAGDGTATYAPVDVWLEQTLRGNALYMNGRDSCTATFYTDTATSLTDNTGARPYSAVPEWQTVMSFDVYVGRGMSGVTLTGCYNCQSEGSNPTLNDMDMKLTVDGIGESVTTLANTYSAGAKFEDLDYTWTFDRPYTGRPGYRRFSIWLRGKVGDTSAWGSVTLTNQGPRYVTASNGDLSNITSSPPAAGSLEVKYLRDSSGEVVEMLGMDPNSTSAELVFTYPSPAYGAGRSDTYAIWDATYAQFRWIGVQPLYEDAAAFAAERGELLPQQTLRGITSVEHIYSLRRLQQRPRLLAFGPTGFIAEVDEEWPNGYAQMWPYIDGDGTGQTYLVDDCVMIDGENPVIKVRMYVLVSHFVPGGHHGNSGLANPAAYDPGQSGWEFTAKVWQMDDGDTAWGSATTWSENTTYSYLQTFPTSYVGHRCLAVTNILRDYADLTTTAPENYGYCYREGTLNAQDFDVLQTIDISVPLTSFTTRQVNPCRITVAASLDSIDSIPWSHDTAAYNERTRCAVVGYSIHSVQEIDIDG